MSKESKKPDNFSTIRHHVRVVAFVVLLLSLLSLYQWYTEKNVGFESKGEVVATSSAEVSIEGPVLQESNPTKLRIPSLSIETEFEEPLGLNQDQTIQVPKSYDEVGWYQYGPTPGELGPAVILGHVDSYEGPAVFFSIGQLEPGDTIEIERTDGTTATFEVTALERYEQSGFPTELVYGDLNFAGLRLITCSGTYNHGTLRYSHNLVVFAKLVE